MAYLTTLTTELGKVAEDNKKTYREYIENTSALIAIGKDPGEIL